MSGRIFGHVDSRAGRRDRMESQLGKNQPKRQTVPHEECAFPAPLDRSEGVHGSYRSSNYEGAQTARSTYESVKRLGQLGMTLIVICDPALNFVYSRVLFILYLLQDTIPKCELNRK